jgi:penicillin-binding protein 2
MDYRQRWEHQEYLTEQRLDRRVRLFHVGLIALLLMFLLDFFYLQLVRADEYALLAESNRLRRIPLEPSRGVVYDRNGEVLASTRPSLRLLLNREDRIDLTDQLKRLAPILGVSYAALDERLGRMRSRPLFEPLVLLEDAGLREIAWIEARREWFRSVEVKEVARRSYPEGDVAAHVLGYVGEVSEGELAAARDAESLQRGDVVGKTGLERRYDDMLRGQRGYKFVSVNTLGRELPLGPSRLGQQPVSGDELELTLDLRLQRTLREAFGDEAGGAVFMDPRTGEVLAMASAPVFDPNTFADGITHTEWQGIQSDPRRPLHDRVISSFYAPGSTFKVVVAVAAVESGAVDPTWRTYCNGSIKIYDRRRLCWKRGGHGWVDLRKALAHSCNVYFYQVGRDAGIDRIHDYGSRFGLGRASGVDLPGERPGVLPSRNWKLETLREPWYPGDTISVAIGQGLLTATPMQMARMISGVATGRLPRPFLVRGTEPVSEPIDLSGATYESIRTALVDAVKRGTARNSAVEGHQVAAKTGTSQVYKHSAGIDAKKLPKAERDHAWFVGYAPAEDPRIAFAVVVEHGGHGGDTAAPIARKVMEVFFSEPEPEPRAEPAPALRASATDGSRRVDVGTPAAR